MSHPHFKSTAEAASASPGSARTSGATESTGTTHAILHFPFTLSLVFAIGLELIFVKDSLERFVVFFLVFLHLLLLLLHFGHALLHLLEESPTFCFAHLAGVFPFSLLAESFRPEVQFPVKLFIQFQDGFLLFGGEVVILSHEGCFLFRTQYFGQFHLRPFLPLGAAPALRRLGAKHCGAYDYSCNRHHQFLHIVFHLF